MIQYLFWGFAYATYGVIYLRIESIRAIKRGDSDDPEPMRAGAGRFPVWVLLWPLLVFKAIRVVCKDIVKKHNTKCT